MEKLTGWKALKALEEGETLIGKTEIMYKLEHCALYYFSKERYSWMSLALADSFDMILKSEFTIKPKQTLKEMVEEVIKPLQPVLVRDHDKVTWGLSLYSDTIERIDPDYPFRTVGIRFAQLAPYEGNEHFRGTTDEIPNAFKAGE